MQVQSNMKLLIINPGSTSTKVSVFDDEDEVFTESVFHDAPVLLRYGSTNDQLPFRTEVVLGCLSRHGVRIEDIDVFVGRGGCAYSQREGVMRIDKRLADDTAADEADESDEAETQATRPGETVYKVQFMALPQKLGKNSKEFKGLSPVEVYYENGYYKYTYGTASSRKEIEADFKKVRRLFKDAFIIAMRDGKRVQ